MHDLPRITLFDYLTTPSYFWEHYPTSMAALLIAPTAVSLLCALAQLVHLSDMFQAVPWRYDPYTHGSDTREGGRKFLMAVFGIILPICWVYFLVCSEVRYWTVARGVIVNTSSRPLTVTDGSESWTVPADGNRAVTVYKWDVQPPPVLTLQGAACPVPGDSTFVVVQGDKRVSVEKVVYRDGDRVPGVFAAVVDKDPSNIPPGYQILLDQYKMYGVVHTSGGLKRVLKPGINPVGSLADSIFPPGESAPSKREGAGQGVFYEVVVEK